MFGTKSHWLGWLNWEICWNAGRRSRDWLTSEHESSTGVDQYSHHLTIGPHGGVDWVRKLGLDGSGRKASDSEIGGTGTGSSSGDELTLHRSTDCIASKDLASSSDSDLLRYVYEAEYSEAIMQQGLHNFDRGKALHRWFLDVSPFLICLFEIFTRKFDPATSPNMAK